MVLDKIISTVEAGKLWGLSPDRVKALCSNGEIQAKKIGNTWVVLKDQPNPIQRHRKKVNYMEDIREGLYVPDRTNLVDGEYVDLEDATYKVNVKDASSTDDEANNN